MHTPAPTTRIICSKGSVVLMLRNPALELEQGTSLAVQWLRLRASIAGDTGSIPGRELRSHMPHNTGKKFKNKIKIELEQDWVSCLVSSEEVKYPRLASKVNLVMSLILLELAIL